MKINNPLSRRSFMKRCAALNALGYAGGLSALGGLSMTSQMAQAQTTRPSGYKAIVCIYLTGGNDLNMLIPTDDDQYTRYQTVRRGVAIPKDDFLSIDSDGDSFGLHPNCGAMKSLYDDGNLAFIANTGSLLEPTTVEQFSNKSVQLPPSIGNHLVQ